MTTDSGDGGPGGPDSSALPERRPERRHEPDLRSMTRINLHPTASPMPLGSFTETDLYLLRVTAIDVDPFRRKPSNAPGGYRQATSGVHSAHGSDVRRAC
ncbi:hypothetical protein [Streptomyces sp. NPDC054854]